MPKTSTEISKNLRHVLVGLLLVIVAVTLSPGDRITWPFLQWRVYVNPSAPPKSVESPVISWQSESGAVDTVYAADLFTPVEIRLSERVLRGAFASGHGALEDAATIEAYRSVIAHRLALEPGTRVSGMSFRWKLDVAAPILFDRTKPHEIQPLGFFVVSTEGGP